MNSDLSIMTLVLEASTVVQLVMLLLLAVSLASWTAIFRKWFEIRDARAATNAFEDRFWSGVDLTGLYEQVSNDHRSGGRRHRDLVNAGHGPLARIFESGMREYGKTRQQRPTDVQSTLDSARRAMRAGYQREMDALETNLAFLASAGSVSPYVGLFGTVWGIMHAFRGLANVQQATLATVAPGIAEALVATAIGLFASIPAVVAYNRFSHDIDRLSNHFDTFIEEFSNVLQRQTR